MKYSMFYHSTRNTRMVAEAVEAYLKEIGAEKVDNAADADLVCVGFWTEKGDANKDARDYMKGLRDSQVFLFGTAGFGDSKTYFDGILEKAEDSLVVSNKIAGAFMCQGKIPEFLRDMLLKEKAEVPYQNAHYELMLQNFDKAQSHPDEADLAAARAAIAAAVASLS